MWWKLTWTQIRGTQIVTDPSKDNSHILQLSINTSTSEIRNPDVKCRIVTKFQTLDKPRKLHSFHVYCIQCVNVHRTNGLLWNQLTIWKHRFQSLDEYGYVRGGQNLPVLLVCFMRNLLGIFNKNDSRIGSICWHIHIFQLTTKEHQTGSITQKQVEWMLMVRYGDDVILAVTTASEPEKRHVLDIFLFGKRLLVKRSVEDFEKIPTTVCSSLTLHDLESLKQASWIDSWGSRILGSRKWNLTAGA